MKVSEQLLKVILEAGSGMDQDAGEKYLGYGFVQICLGVRKNEFRV